MEIPPKWDCLDRTLKATVIIENQKPRIHNKIAQIKIEY